MIDKERKLCRISLHKLDNSDLLTGDVAEELSKSVHAFEAAPTNTKAKKKVKLFMTSRLAVCPSCRGMLIKRVSIICSLQKQTDTATYVRRGTFKSFPLGAPVVDGDDKLVGIVTDYDEDKFTDLQFLVAN